MPVTHQSKMEIKDEFYEELEEEIRMYSWWWETSTQELDRTIQDEKEP